MIYTDSLLNSATLNLEVCDDLLIRRRLCNGGPVVPNRRSEGCPAQTAVIGSVVNYMQELVELVRLFGSVSVITSFVKPDYMGAFRNTVEGIKDIAKSFDEKNYNPDLLGMITVIVDLGHTVWEKQEADRVGMQRRSRRGLTRTISTRSQN